MILNIQSNTDLMAEEEAKRAIDLESQSQGVVQGLAGYVRRCFEAAAQARRPIEDRMLDCLRRRRGEYSPEELQEIQASGAPSAIYMKITDAKCHGALSWIEDLLLVPGDKPWGVKPTPLPDLPPELREEIARSAAAVGGLALQRGIMPNPAELAQLAQQLSQTDEAVEATKAAARKEDERIERAIEDVLEEGGWRQAFKEFLDNLVTFPAAIIKGPIWEMRPTMKWVPGQSQPVVEDKPTLVWKAPSPFDIFPAPTATTVDDGYLCERHNLTRRDLAALKGIDGYDADAIDAVLEEYGRNGLDDWSVFVDPNQRKFLEDKSTVVSDPEGRIAAVQFWGWVQGQQLLDFGLPPEQVADPLADYAAEVWVIGRYVIKAEINGDSLGRRPYHKTSMRLRPGSFWGEGLPEVIADCQDMANRTARAMSNNQAISSGPQVGVDIAQFAEGENITALTPWHIWQFDMSRNQTTRPPMWFFQPDSRVAELKTVFEFFLAMADESSAIPRYLGGQNPQTGAAGTASGLSMLMGNTSKGLKRIISNVDIHVVEPAITRTFETLLLFGLVETYRGDIKIVARGSTALIAKEQAMLRRNEFLQIVTGSPLIQNIMGLPAIADLLRAHVRDLAIGADDAIPTGEELQRRMAAAMQAAQNAPPPAAPQPQGKLPRKPQAAMPDGSPPGGKMVAQFQPAGGAG